MPFTERNVTDDPEAMAELATQRSFATPLLVVGDQMIVGYHPQALVALPDEEGEGEASDVL